MRPIRLLPVVIFAALALLLFKGIGLVTNGGYVLTGTTAVVAEETASGDAAQATPSEATVEDSNPTLDDPSPTLATAKGEASSVADESSSVSSEMNSSSDAMSASGSSEPEPGPSSAAEMPPPKVSSACPPSASAPAGEAAQSSGDKTAPSSAADCAPSQVASNEPGDALPMTMDKTGKIVPLQAAEGDNSEQALLQRLAERRADLDKREADLEMRAGLVDAAEKKLDERTKQLQELETKVAALVDEKQAAEDAGFKGIVSMYEQMKPKDAAKIFDTLKLNVLLKIARAMNPRKVSPILAAMSSEPAQALTTALAMIETPTTPASPPGSENLAALPQIVGH